MIAEFASVLIRLEETGVRDAFIPDHVRVRGETISFDMVQKKGRLCYSRAAESSATRSRRTFETVDISW